MEEYRKEEYLVVCTKEFYKYVIGDSIPTDYKVDGLLADYVEDLSWVEEKEGIFYIDKEYITDIKSIILEYLPGKQSIRWASMNHSDKVKLV